MLHCANIYSLFTNYHCSTNIMETIAQSTRNISRSATQNCRPGINVQGPIWIFSKNLAPSGFLGIFDCILSYKIFMEIVIGLLYCHQTLNIAHRDLKPQNLLLDHKFNIKSEIF